MAVFDRWLAETGQRPRPGALNWTPMSDPGHAAGGGRAWQTHRRLSMRAPHGPPSRLVVPGAGDAQQPCQRVESFGRAPAVFDLITSSTSGQLDRDTADRLRPRAPPPGALLAVREAPPGMTSHRGLHRDDDSDNAGDGDSESLLHAWWLTQGWGLEVGENLLDQAWVVTAAAAVQQGDQSASCESLPSVGCGDGSQYRQCGTVFEMRKCLQRLRIEKRPGCHLGRMND